ncbi:MAG: hypothetical protein H6595_08185 [Flavobacteriales bacterium]|nr:hypothetical protein [Flavobacteriales bacterium]MCB9167444.1 hypothetical protein [Flavobacteriales bacterium]MCB9171047.1 hypothetical protein [Flavobacteriales bacterium]
MNIAIEHKEDKRAGLIGTIIFHVLLLLLFLFIGLTQPVPLPEETGIEIAMADFGTTDEGSGTTETPDPGPQDAATAPAVSDQSPDTPEDVATEEESPVEQVKPKEPKPKPQPNEKPKEPKPEKPKEPQVSDQLSNALNSWGQGGGGNSGEGTSQTPGNAGVQTGVPEGLGTFHGDGWSVSLGGRGLVKGPNISDKPSEAGKVVLNIFVDRGGKVTRVTPNLDKSTTTSQVLFGIARKAALQCSFSAKPDGAAEQRGEMTFIFILE